MRISIYKKRVKQLALICIFGSTLCACDDDGKKSTVRVTFESDVASFVAIVTFDDTSTEQISCPDSGAGNDTVRCIPNGIQTTVPKERLEIVIKARGYEFISKSYEVDELAPAGSSLVVKLPLVPIAPFMVHDDYVTGFSEDDGLERFKSLAVDTETELGKTWTVKFYVESFRGEPEVYFQNTPNYPLHYQFARKVLGDPRSGTAFETETYSGDSREAVAGTLVFYESVHKNESSEAMETPMSLGFATYDDISPEQVLRAHQILEARLGFLPIRGDDARLVYTPAGDAQEIEYQAKEQLFARRDARVLYYEELWGTQTVQLLNEGVAYGALRRITPEELEKTVVSFTDILILTRLPAALPGVGGTITEELQTPLAHVNVAARARGTPNMALLDAASDEHLVSLIGKLVRFEVRDGDYSIKETTAEEAEAYRESQSKPRLSPEFDLTGEEFIDFEEANFSDSIVIGAKAANLGELKRLLGDQAPSGFGVPFFYYDQFLQNTAITTESCEEGALDCYNSKGDETICERAGALCLDLVNEGAVSMADYLDALLEDTDFRGDTLLRDAALHLVRYHIESAKTDDDLSKKLSDKIHGMFGQEKVRLRSSTNAEDLAVFSGAGLYKSVSAYSTGSYKPAAEQIRKVWASVWNWRAFEERSFWNMDHRAVKMGVAVNQSFPNEAANGVLITKNLINPMEGGMYVNLQLGETSVTNPEGGVTPEVFAIVPGPAQKVQVTRLAYSSLSPESPILSEEEIRELAVGAAKVADHFKDFYESMPLELEFKFHGPQRAFFIKQTRPFLE